MINKKKPIFRLFLLIFPVILLSCNYSEPVPFPNYQTFLQPETSPLQFTASKFLSWDTAKQGRITPAIKKLDLDLLPSRPFDSSGFQPFKQAPVETNFDVNALPGTNVNLDKLASIPLQFKTSVLKAPVIIKSMKPARLGDSKLSIFDFGESQGLRAKLIIALLKDRQGLMWIAGAEGISMYDGDYIKIIIPESSEPPVAGLAEDNNGKIWFIRANAGIGMIDQEKGIIRYSKKIGGVFQKVSQIAKDGKGQLWVYNNIDKAVSIINPENFTYKNLDKKAGLSDSAACGVIQDSYRNVWITTETGGANIINAATGKINYLRQLNGLGSDSLTAITVDKKGQVWMAEKNGGLNAVNAKDGRIRHYNHFQGLKKSVPLSLLADDKNRLWVGTFQGITLIDHEKEMSRIINQDHGMAANAAISFAFDDYNRLWVSTLQGLNLITQFGETVYPLGRTRVITMLEDAGQSMWVGTDKGIEIIDVKKNVIRTLNKSDGLGHNFIQSFFKVDQKMWVSTNGGLDIIDPVSKTIHHTGKNEGLVNDTIYAVFTDKGGNTWLTGPSNGIDLIDKERKIIWHTDQSKGLSDNNIQDVKQDKDGLLWLATNKGGIDVYDPKAGTVKFLNNQPGLRDTCNKMMLVDSYGRVWIGTDKGIYVADIKQNIMTAITTKQGLTSNRILSLLEYKGTVIAGTDNKACIITAPVSAKATGAAGQVNSSWKVSVLNNSEGLIRGQRSAWATDGVTSDGRFLWGDRGITIIHDIEPEVDSVPTFITGINVMTQPQYFFNDWDLKKNDTLWTSDTFYVGSGGSMKSEVSTTNRLKWDSVTGPYNLPTNLQLPFDQNYLQFNFSQTHLSRQDTTWYSYILEGIDKKWSLPTTNSFTENYLNLAPGNYTFRVSSKGISGKWSNPESFSFTILPPWYKTWWALTLFALLSIGAIRAYISYRSRKLQRENKLLEEKIAVRTKQLQQSIEDLKSTQMQLIQSEKMASLGELTAGIAHEIQNPLNFVNNFSDVNTELIEELKNELKADKKEEALAIADDIKENEQKISEHGKRADAIVKGMLQHSRANSGKKELADINALADEYLRLSYHGLKAKDKGFNANFTTDLDGSISKIEVVPQDVGRVLLNLYNNAFYAVSEKKKQLNGTFEPSVLVSTKRVGDKIELSVKDNGTGIPEKLVDKIFQPFYTTKPTGQGTGLGLSLSYDIIKAHGGELKVETKEGEYAEFTVQLPA